jgi:hypothetical protein
MMRPRSRDGKPAVSGTEIGDRRLEVITAPARISTSRLSRIGQCQRATDVNRPRDDEADSNSPGKSKEKPRVENDDRDHEPGVRDHPGVTQDADAWSVFWR